MLRSFLFAVATLVVSANLLPVRAQVIGGQTLSNIMFGADSSDPTATWTTTLIITNTSQVAQGVDVLIKDAVSGYAVDNTVIDVDGNLVGDVGLLQIRGLPPLAEIRYTIKGQNASAVASSAQIMVTNTLGDSLQGGFPVVAAAIVQKTAVNGKILSSSEMVDPKTVSTTIGSNFVVPVMLGTAGSDTMLLLSNSGTTSFPVTISVQNGIGYDPTQTVVATVTVDLAPGMVAQTVSQLFAGNVSLQNFFLQGPPPGWNSPFDQSVVTVTSGQPFALAVSRANASPDGSVIQTSSNSFPLAQMPAAQ